VLLQRRVSFLIYLRDVWFWFDHFRPSLHCFSRRLFNTSDRFAFIASKRTSHRRSISSISPFISLLKLFRLSNDGIERELRLAVTIKQQRLALGAPGVRVVRAPEGDHLHQSAVLDKRAENAGVSVGQFFVGVTDESALSGRGVVGDVRAKAALAASRQFTSSSVM
jgi:hypothetical protein